MDALPQELLLHIFGSLGLKGKGSVFTMSCICRGWHETLTKGEHMDFFWTQMNYKVFGTSARDTKILIDLLSEEKADREKKECLQYGGLDSLIESFSTAKTELPFWTKYPKTRNLLVANLAVACLHEDTWALFEFAEYSRLYCTLEESHSVLAQLLNKTPKFLASKMHRTVPFLPAVVLQLATIKRTCFVSWRWDRLARILFSVYDRKSIGVFLPDEHTNPAALKLFKLWPTGRAKGGAELSTSFRLASLPEQACKYFGTSVSATYRLPGRYRGLSVVTLPSREPSSDTLETMFRAMHEAERRRMKNILGPERYVVWKELTDKGPQLQRMVMGNMKEWRSIAELGLLVALRDANTYVADITKDFLSGYYSFETNLSVILRLLLSPSFYGRRKYLSVEENAKECSGGEFLAGEDEALLLGRRLKEDFLCRLTKEFLRFFGTLRGTSSVLSTMVPKYRIAPSTANTASLLVLRSLQLDVLSKNMTPQYFRVLSDRIDFWSWTFSQHGATGELFCRFTNAKVFQCLFELLRPSMERMFGGPSVYLSILETIAARVYPAEEAKHRIDMVTAAVPQVIRGAGALYTKLRVVVLALSRRTERLLLMLDRSWRSCSALVDYCLSIEKHPLLTASAGVLPHLKEIFFEEEEEQENEEPDKHGETGRPTTAWTRPEQLIHMSLPHGQPELIVQRMDCPEVVHALLDMRAQVDRLSPPEINYGIGEYHCGYRYASYESLKLSQEEQRAAFMVPWERRKLQKAQEEERRKFRERKKPPLPLFMNLLECYAHRPWFAAKERLSVLRRLCSKEFGLSLTAPPVYLLEETKTKEDSEEAEKKAKGKEPALTHAVNPFLQGPMECKEEAVFWLGHMEEACSTAMRQLKARPCPAIIAREKEKMDERSQREEETKGEQRGAREPKRKGAEADNQGSGSTQTEAKRTSHLPTVDHQHLFLHWLRQHQLRQNDTGDSVLHVQCNRGVIQLLLDHGADPYAVNKGGAQAAMRGDKTDEVREWLVSLTYDKMTPTLPMAELWCAKTRYKRLPYSYHFIRFLVDHGLDLSQCSYLMQFVRNPSFFLELISRGAVVPEGVGGSPMAEAILSGDLNTLKGLLKGSCPSQSHLSVIKPHLLSNKHFYQRFEVKLLTTKRHRDAVLCLFRTCEHPKQLLYKLAYCPFLEMVQSRNLLLLEEILALGVPFPDEERRACSRHIGSKFRFKARRKRQRIVQWIRIAAIVLEVEPTKSAVEDKLQLFES